MQRQTAAGWEGGRNWGTAWACGALAWVPASHAGSGAAPGEIEGAIEIEGEGVAL